jgi:uncharacterized surface protein with fasciclin (FAS1) repeats
MNKRQSLLALLGAAVLTLSGCASLGGSGSTLADVTAKTPELSTLNSLIQQAGLAETLRGAVPYTVFAPSNEAFKAIPAATLADLAMHPEQLKSVLSYHVLPGKVTAAEVVNGQAKTLQGASVALSHAGSFVTVEDAVVTQADVAASNGVIHVIDRVLMPPKK